MSSHYNTLKISKNATSSEIKKAYIALSKLYHPDKGGNEKDLEKVTKAFKILSDEKLRSEYDRTLLLQANNEKNHHDFVQDAKLYFESEIKRLSDAEIADTEKSLLFYADKDDAISMDKFLQKQKDLKYGREQLDIESAQPKLFNNTEFNLDKFNQLYEELCENNNQNDEIIDYQNLGTLTDDKDYISITDGYFKSNDSQGFDKMFNKTTKTNKSKLETIDVNKYEERSINLRENNDSEYYKDLLMSANDERDFFNKSLDGFYQKIQKEGTTFKSNMLFLE